jgi:hypothetical protein
MFDHAGGVRAAVDVVAEEDQLIVRGRCYQGQQVLELRPTTVDVADSEQPAAAGSWG